MKKLSKVAGRPPAFVYRSASKTRVLCCEELAMTRMAAKYGTPLYVYSASTVRERYAAFNEAFARVPHTVCYSVKANSNLTLLKMLAKMGSGFDVVSGGELERVLIADKKAANRVVFSGVGKTAEEMDAALAAGILMFNVESEGECELLASRAAQVRKVARVAFRVNPDVPAETHPYIATGLSQHKFGVPIARARELYALAAQQEWLEPIGVSVHIGSQITNVSPFTDTMTRVATLVRELWSDGLNIAFIDAGGGLGIPYHDVAGAKFSATAKKYAEAVCAPLKGMNLHLLLEPGRAIVAPAGALLTRVLYTKENGGKRFVIVDAAMNDLIRPSLYGAYHEIVAVEEQSARAKRGATSTLVDIVGPVCESGDFFARDRELPDVNSGDLLAILDAGAYGMSLASNYNTRPRPAELLVEGSKARVIRRRENTGDVIAAEV